MEATKFFKAMTKVTAKGAHRGILQFIYRHAETEDTETLVATDEHIIAVAIVSKTDVEVAITRDIIVRIENECGCFYIDRKRKDVVPDNCYPKWLKAIPNMRRVDVSGKYSEPPKAHFNPALLALGVELIESYFYKKKGAIMAFKVTHIPYVSRGSVEAGFVDEDRPDMVHAHISKGLMIGIMPCRFESGNDFGPEKVDKDTILTAIEGE